MSRSNYDRVHGYTPAPPPQSQLPPHSFTSSQQPPELVDESDTSPGVTSPLTPNWAEQLPELLHGRIHDWDQASEGGFPSRDVGRFTIAGVPTLGNPQPKGLSIALTARSVQSTLSQHRPPPSETSFTGGSANFSNTDFGSAFRYPNYPHPSNISISSHSQDSQPSVSSYGKPPSLSQTTTTMGSDEPSLITIGDEPMGFPILEEVNQVLTDDRYRQLPDLTYQCAFWFLDCAMWFSSVDEWKTHCLSHFNREKPPITANCPLCATAFRGRDAWDQRMDHVLKEHHNHGFGLEGSRPDFDLFKWLWKKRIIDNATLKELEGNFDSRRNEVLSTVNEGRATEARREAWSNRRH